MSYEFYKVLHLVAIIWMFVSLGAHGLFASLSSKAERPDLARLLAISHGLALVVALVAGFGLLARLGILAGWPIWVFGKLGIWFLLGGITVFYKKSQAPVAIKLGVTVLIGICGVLLAVLKPV